MSKSKSILIIDEDRAQLKILQKQLTPLQKRWDVHFASTADEVRDQLLIRPFDIVSTELIMDGFNEGSILEEIKHRQPGAIRFITSAAVNSDNFLQYINFAHQFITKPYAPTELLGKIKKSLRLKNIFLNERAAKAIASVDKLPTLPSLFLRLENELKKEDVSIRDIGKIISEDVSMTAGILKIVNSPFFGLFSRVTNPEQAVALLGLDAVKGIVLGTFLFNTKGADLVDFSIEDLGEHCRYTALMARAIIKSEGADADQMEKTFLAGFLHDLGKLLLATSYREEYKMILSEVRENNIPIQEVEKDILSFTHAEVGAYLLALWGFSEDVVEAVYCHHELNNLGSNDLSPAVAVHVANSFDHELRVHNNEYAPHRLDAQWLEMKGFSSHLVQWLEACGEAMEDDVGVSE